MARITFMGPLGAGHVNPTLGIAAELVHRGHEVSYAAPRMFAERIRETGARYVPATSTWEAMPRGAVPQMHGAELVRAMGLLLDETKAMVKKLDSLPKPDLVVHDGTLAWWGRILAHRWGVPAVETWPNFVSNSHWNMQSYAKINPLHPRFLLTMLRIGRYVRREGIRDVGGFMQGATAAARIVTIPRAFQPEGHTFGDSFHFVGPVLTERRFQGDWQPPDGKPVLLVSLGTAYNDRPEFFRTIMETAEDRQWHVVMAIGDSVSRRDLGNIPLNVEVHEQVPQTAVLRHAAAFVTHAGMGGVLEGFAHEVPMLAVPQMAEQRANADRLVELGLGTQIPPDQITPDRFWSTVEDLTDDPRIRGRLNWMKAEIEAAGGASAAADVVESALPA
ncbi:macrolide family glycosyltransferase [Brevibacterium sp.]|uniref:macrolide family glycosyltransferase n=1 Tax=Brevibacterium sp. TaxID=1701 RepID=UPI002811965D|nr:macrolide family glycosyltransferase [Brevibacterium sp.]